MKIYATIDDNGIDGFGFTKQDKIARQLRAMANHFRGMRFIEKTITKKQSVKLYELARAGKLKACGKYLLKI